jgi:hypothetical protein
MSEPYQRHSEQHAFPLIVSHRQKSHKRKIHRSAAAKDQFMRDSGYPHGRKGYVVDHKIPLACGGADSPSNMQWQTKVTPRPKISGNKTDADSSRASPNTYSRSIVKGSGFPAKYFCRASLKILFSAAVFANKVIEDRNFRSSGSSKICSIERPSTSITS